MQKYQEAYEKIKQVRSDLEKLRQSGNSLYDCYTIEAQVKYSASEKIESADWETLDALEEFTINSADSIIVSRAQDEGPKELLPLENYFLLELSWNIGIFNRPEFQNKKIAYLLHTMFHDGNYALNDLVCMNTDDIDVCITVELM